MAMKKMKIKNLPLKDLKSLYGKVIDEIDFRERLCDTPPELLSTEDLHRLYASVMVSIRHRRVARVSYESKNRMDLPVSVLVLIRQVEQDIYSPYVSKHQIDTLLGVIEEDMELV